jgi:large subunit ribosomal protein L25
VSDQITLAATLRTEFGKGAARRARRAHTIPAVLYGHGTEPVHLTLPGHDTFLALKGRANALVTLEFENHQELALVKDVQRDPIKPVIDHVDLVLVRKGEKVHVEIPVTVVGESAPGTVAAQDLAVIKVVADATRIPERVEVSVEGAEAGTVFRAGDLTLPPGTELETDAEAIVIGIALPATEAEPEAAEAAEVETLAAAAEESAEG